MVVCGGAFALGPPLDTRSAPHLQRGGLPQGDIGLLGLPGLPPLWQLGTMRFDSRVAGAGGLVSRGLFGFGA